MCNLKYTISFLILCGLIIFASCNDADVSTPDASKKNDKFLNGPLTSLEGTVWIHHPDTDPESNNWLNVMQRSGTSYFEEYYGNNPAEISFTKDRIFDGTDEFAVRQQHFYLYDYPKVVISRSPDPEKLGNCECPGVMSFNKNLECQCGRLYYFGFIGYINETGDTMNLRRYIHNQNSPERLERDVVLIRIK